MTPKEHREMLDRQTLMEMQKQQREQDREWRIKDRKVILLTAIISAAATLAAALIGAWLSHLK